MITKRLPAFIEVLESRIAPAALALSGTLLGYTATPGIVNSLTIDLAGGIYTFTDSAETITLNAAAISAGFSGSGTNTVTGPASALDGIRIQLGNGNDTLNLNGLADGLAVLDDIGSDTVNVNTGADVVNDNVSIEADIVNIASLTGVLRLTLDADTLAVSGNVGMTGDLFVRPLTAGRPINLGSEVGGSLSLTAAELSSFSAPNKIAIGRSNSGAITVSAGLTLTNTDVLSLRTGGTITTVGAAGIAVESLGIDAGSGVALGAANIDIDFFAASVESPGTSLTIADLNGFQIGTVDGITGITAVNVAISGGAMTQAASAPIVSANLTFQGAGPVTLLDADNDVGTLAANLTGSIQFSDVNSLQVGNTLFFAGVRSTDGNVSLTAAAGELRITNGNASPDPDIVADGVIALTAGVVGSDFPITIDANAGVSSESSLLFRADAMQIGAAVVGAQSVQVQPFESSSAINLGGGDTAATLGFTDAELDFFNAPSLTVGLANFATVLVSTNISPSGVPTLVLNAASVTGAGSITVPTLDFDVDGPFAITGASDVDTLRGFTFGGGVTFSDIDGFSVASLPSELFALSANGPILRTLNAGSGVVSIASGDDLVFFIQGSSPGTQYDQWVISGGLNLTGARLSSGPNFLPVDGTVFVLIDNDGTDPIVGTFDGRPEGSILAVGGRDFALSYKGGTGNDVTLTAIPPLAVTLSNGGKTATFTDVDGDLVTVKTSKGAFDGTEFIGIELGPNGAGQLQRLDLDADFTGTNLTITAKPSVNGGNGFVNVGFIDAFNVDLGGLRIKKDLGRITAGTVGDHTSFPGVRSLIVQSMGLLGTSTQGAGASLQSGISGALKNFVVKDDFRGVLLDVNGDDGFIGKVSIGGSFVATDRSVAISGQIGIGSLKVGGDIRASSTSPANINGKFGAIGLVTVGGSVIGDDADTTVNISALGQIVAPTKGLDLALKGLSVRGSVENTVIALGGFVSSNADASVGVISVGGDWIASSVRSGVSPGADLFVGTADDAKLNFGAQPRDNPALFSTIGSFQVKGQAFGTTGSATDMFGIVAERIGKAKVGGRTFAFTNGATPEAFFAAPTLNGAGAEDPMFDFAIREIGSTTPTPNFGGVNLIISANGKVATFTDVDGDLVTVKRTQGSFVSQDFDIAAEASGGGRLNVLKIAAAAGNLSVTARPGPLGGNGRVNVEAVDASNVDLGNILIGGELAELGAGDANADQPGIRSLTVGSVGQLVGGSGLGSKILITQGAGKITVLTNARTSDIGVTGQLGEISIGGYLLDDLGVNAGGIGSVKIGGSVLDGSSLGANEAIRAVTIGGDLVGSSGESSRISAFGRATSPASGSDVAIGRIVIKGSVENTRIDAGRFANADAGIGSISVGHAWIGSNLVAGVGPGSDGLTGTADDTKNTATRDEAAIFSQIASVIIKGQAIGSATAGDHFGIVAEQIGKARVGAVKFVLTKGERDAGDARAIAPTGGIVGAPGSDFFLREIVV